MPYKEKDALGVRRQERGNLVVHLLFNVSEVGAQLAQWGRIGMYIGGLWIFLNYPTLAIMLLFGMRAVAS
jgi:hypothetical protein